MAPKARIGVSTSQRSTEIARNFSMIPIPRCPDRGRGSWQLSSSTTRHATLLSFGLVTSLSFQALSRQCGLMAGSQECFGDTRFERTPTPLDTPLGLCMTTDALDRDWNRLSGSSPLRIYRAAPRASPSQKAMSFIITTDTFRTSNPLAWSYALVDHMLGVGRTSLV